MTTAQRARLVIAMGLLNLILATVALTAGFVAPSRPGDVAGVTGTPAPTIPAVPTAVPSVQPTPTGSPETPGPTASAPLPSAPASATPSAEPSGSTAAPSGGPIVADLGSPTPGPVSSPPATPPAVATPRPTPPPTAHPTPRPTPTPAPVSQVHKPRPPCPADVDGPPGHHKVTPLPSRPCSSGRSHGGAGGANGMVVVLPLALGGLAATVRTRLSTASRRVTRAARSTAARRRARRAPRS